LRLALGPWVDAAAIAGGYFLFAVAVEDLNFVEPLELDAGVRALRNHEFEMHFDVAEFLFGDDVAGASARAVDEHAAAGLIGKHFRILRIERDAARNDPLAATRLLPRFQSSFACQLNPAGIVRSAGNIRRQEAEKAKGKDCE